MGRRKKDYTLKATGGRDSDISDLESVAYSSVAGDFSTEDEDITDSTVTVDSFAEQIDNAQDKRIATRMQATNNLCQILKRNCIAETAEKWKLTLCDIIEKCLKRTDEEITRGCDLAGLLSLQLGVEVEEDILGIINILRANCADESAAENLRSACAQTIGFCVYLSCEQFSIRSEALQTLQSVWSSMKVSNVQPTLFTSALFSWVLLLERCDSNFISSCISSVQPKLCQFLDYSSVDVRISAGEALAVLYEIAVDNISDNFHFSNHEHLRRLLTDLTMDSAKYRAKRDKKFQKFSFRQINDAIFNDNLPQTQIKFNKREELNIVGCHMKLFYDLLCQLLKSDVNLHLSRNELIRDIFDLGPIVEELNATKTKEEKLERKNFFDASTKARNMHRAKQRDKKGF